MTLATKITPRKLGSVVQHTEGEGWLLEYWSSNVWTVTVRAPVREFNGWVWLAHDTDQDGTVHLRVSYDSTLSCFPTRESAEEALASWLLQQGG